MKETPWSRNQGTKQRVQRILGDCWQWEANGQCSRGDNCSFRHDINKRAKVTQPNPSPNSFMQQSALQDACSTRPRAVADLVKSARMHIVRLMNILLKGPKKHDDKSAVAMLKKYDLHDRTWQLVVNRDESHDRSGQPVVERDARHELKHGPVGCRSSNTRQLGCVFQDMEPPKLSPIFRKSSDMQKPIQRVKFTKAVVHHADIRDQNSSLGLICPGDSHQRSSNAPNFEDRSQEETEWQERRAREAAWKLAKSVLKLKEKNKAASFSPSENRCLPTSYLKPEERAFVVDSFASMHMISKKDLNDAEMDTLTKSCSPTTVIIANG